MQISGMCSICDGLAKPAYTCSICGAIACSKCFSYDLGLCVRCAAQAKKGP